MKRGIITLLSVLAIAFAFAGCGDSGSKGASNVPSTNTVTENNDPVKVSNDEAAATKAEVKASIEEKLGAIPVIPGT